MNNPDGCGRLFFDFLVPAHGVVLCVFFCKDDYSSNDGVVVVVVFVDEAKGRVGSFLCCLKTAERYDIGRTFL